MQHRMALAVEPGAGKVEGRARPVHESQHVLVEAHGGGEIAGGDVVMIEQTDAHAHGFLLNGFCLGGHVSILAAWGCLRLAAYREKHVMTSRRLADHDP